MVIINFSMYSNTFFYSLIEIIKLVVILLFVESDSSSFKKCCLLNYELSINSTNISNFNRENINCQLSLTGNLIIANTSFVNVGFPDCINFQLVNAYNRSIKVFCLDRVQEYNDVFGIACSDHETTKDFFQLPSIISFRKCCPFNRKYNAEKQFCWNPVVKDDAYTPYDLAKIIINQNELVVNISIGVPLCHVNNILLDTIIMSEQISYSQNSIRINDAGPFSYDDFCIDIIDDIFEYVVVRSCRNYSNECKNKNLTCVRKCCHFGYEYDENYDCVPSQRFLSLTFQNSTHDNSNNTAKPAFLQGDICISKYVLEDDVEEDKHILTTDGKVYKFESKNIFDVDEYCVENMKSDNKTKIYICFPKELNDFLYMKMILVNISLVISIIFLLLTFAIYLILPSLRNLSGKLIMCFSATSAWSYIIIVLLNILPLEKLPTTCCPILGYVLQFTFLSSFSWLNVISYDIWSTFKDVRSKFWRKSSNCKKFFISCLIGWGCPLVWTGITILCQYTSIMDNFSKWKPDIGENICFFANNGRSKLIFYEIPVSAMISLNLIFFVLTVKYCFHIRRILKISNDKYSSKKYDSHRNEFLLSTKLFVVMGINWSMEIVSFCFELKSNIIFIIFDVINALSGFFIFCIFIMKRTILTDLKIKLQFRRQIRRASTFTTSTISSIFANL